MSYFKDSKNNNAGDSNLGNDLSDDEQSNQSLSDSESDDDDDDDGDIKNQDSEDDFDDDNKNQDIDAESESEDGPEEDEEATNTSNNVSKKKVTISSTTSHSGGAYPDTDDDSENVDDESYLQRFNQELNQNLLVDAHPECITMNYDEILTMAAVVRNSMGIIVDPLHKSIPFLTKFEKSRIVGQRASQLDSGAMPFMKIPEHIIESHLIAELELAEKKMPFIIRRPMPNGGSEYWHVKDLENVAF